MTDTPLAVFDLDGTLTTRDSFLAYLTTYGRRRRKLSALTKMPFRISSYLLKLKRDYQLKQQLLTSFFAGVPRNDIQEHTDWFCRNWLPGHRHPIGLRLLNGHLDKGHRVILLSASPDLYVSDIGKAMGVTETICTRVRFNGDLCTGMIDGKNCKGAEKTTRLLEHLSKYPASDDSHAYGDSKHDLPVLQWARKGYLLTKKTCQLVTPEPDAKPQLERQQVRTL